MSERIRIGVNGAAGRMGQRIVALTHQSADLKVGAALEGENCPALGRDAGEAAGIGPIHVPIQAELEGRVDVIIDFSVPEGLMRVAKLCADRRIPLVAATTGLTPAQKAAVAAAAQVTAVLQSPSMSLAVNLTMKLVREAAKTLATLPDGVDVEVIERHHRYKEDAPSGTALRFGEIVA